MNTVAQTAFQIAMLGLCLARTGSAATLWTDQNRAALRELVQNDAEAKTLFEPIQASAAAAATAEPNPVARIVSEGRLQSDPLKKQTAKALEDMKTLTALGYTFIATDDARYANDTRRFLLAWAGVNRSTGNPINDTALEPAIAAYDLVRSGCVEKDRARIDAWFRSVAEALIESARKSPQKNNWQSHRLKTIGLIGLVIHDEQYTHYAIDGLKKQIDNNLLPDGSGMDFKERDALHYHLYTLRPMLTLAIAARHVAPALYTFESPRGCSLKKSVQFLVPFCDGTKTHEEFVNSKVAFDRKRGEAGEKNFETGHAFDPKSGVTVLTLASFFDQSLKPLVLRVEGTADKRFANWQSVLIAAQADQ